MEYQCNRCKSNDIVVESVYVEHPHMVCAVICNECKHRFFEIYALTYVGKEDARDLRQAVQ